ncbi:hypothetical protein ACIO93_26055 [Streptomyces sp. NPDC087903]|uniref:hypothetical protein n=1 Tax=Streptomyces sp. NPDC087903 TaxID=3365819 RepID=UPI0038012AD3
MTSPATSVAVHPSASEPGEGIWFATPAGFLPLPVAALALPPDSTGMDPLEEALAPILLSAPDEASRQRFIGTLAFVRRMFRSVHSEGTVHCSLGLHRDDTGGGDGSALASLFAITWLDTAWAPRGVTAARAVVSVQGHSHIAYAEVPCGPATFSETVRVPTAESGLPQNSLLQVFAHLPHPDGTSLALLTLSTTAVARREQYRAMLRRIAHTVTFEDPFASGVDPGRSGGEGKRP